MSRSLRGRYSCMRSHRGWHRLRSIMTDSCISSSASGSIRCRCLNWCQALFLATSSWLQSQQVLHICDIHALLTLAFASASFFGAFPGAAASCILVRHVPRLEAVPPTRGRPLRSMQFSIWTPCLVATRCHVPQSREEIERPEALCKQNDQNLVAQREESR